MMVIVDIQGAMNTRTVCKKTKNRDSKMKYLKRDIF